MENKRRVINCAAAVILLLCMIMECSAIEARAVSARCAAQVYSGISGWPNDPIEKVGEAMISSELKGLSLKLEQMLSEEEGTWSVYIKDLKTGAEASINNQQMYAASLIKLFVMESAYQDMEQIIENDIPYSGGEEASREKVQTMLTEMITVSDNNAYNELVRMHSSEHNFPDGCQNINTYLKKSDYKDTSIYHTLHPSDSEMEKTEKTKNQTTVEDCGAFLESIYNKTCVSESASEEMMNLLMKQERTGKIPMGVPEGVTVANKTGETDTEQHDAAIVFGPDRDYILCVMSTGVYDVDEAVWTIQDISEVVYKYLISS